MTTEAAGQVPALRPKVLGKTGLEVCPISIGCAPLGDMPETFAYGVSEEQALETIRAIFKSPITFFDTAASYGDGESERRIGIVLKELGGVPPGFLIATKADRDLQSGDFSGDQMKRSVERSLKLLGLDTLELVYLHDPEHAPFDQIVAPGGAIDVLSRLRDNGVIKHLGLAGGPTSLMMRYLETGAFEATISHNRFTLVNRSGAPLIDLATRMGLGVVNAAPYGSGILAKGPDVYARYAYQDASPVVVDRVRRIAEICEGHGVPMAAAALQFSLRDPRVHNTVVGMTKPERVAQTVELASFPIPDTLWAELETVGYDDEDPEKARWK